MAKRIEITPANNTLMAENITLPESPSEIENNKIELLLP